MSTTTLTPKTKLNKLNKISADFITNNMGNLYQKEQGDQPTKALDNQDLDCGEVSKEPSYKYNGDIGELDWDYSTPTTTDEDFKKDRYNTSPKSCVGAYMSKIGNHKILSSEEEKKLGSVIQKGTQKKKDKAILCLMEHNLKLAVAVASEYQNRGLDLEDLISEANIGLRKAAERFDPTRGAKFSTYAYNWIKQTILRSIHTKARMVRLPTHLIEKISKVRKVQESLSRSLGREISNEELCSQTGNSTKVIERLLTIQSQTTHIDQSSSQDLRGEDDSCDILKKLADSNQPSPHELSSKKSDWETIEDILHELPEREKRILSLRYGLGVSQAQTLEEVGKATNLSRERVRQIENIAIAKIKDKLEKLDKSKKIS